MHRMEEGKAWGVFSQWWTDESVEGAQENQETTQAGNQVEAALERFRGLVKGPWQGWGSWRTSRKKLF